MQQEEITPRERRLITQHYMVDKEKKGVIRWKNGNLFKGVKIEGQKVTLDFSQVYPDDVLAIVRDILVELSTPEKDKEPAPFTEYNVAAIDAITQAINIMDLRAVHKHGYSYSPNEQKVPVTYDDSYLTFVINMKKQQK